MITYQTLWVGDLRPNLVFTVVSKPSNTPVDLTDATCSVLFGPGQGNTNAGFVGSGSGTIATNVYTYQLGSTDTATPGLWVVQLEAVFPGSIPQHFSVQQILIQTPVVT